MHYQGMPPNFVSVHKSDSPFCEGVEIRIADFSLTGSGYNEILSRSGGLRDRGRGSEKPNFKSC